MFEVEAKLEVPDLEALRGRLRALGARCIGSETQEDTFFLHPCRDMAKADETLRLRRRGKTPASAAGIPAAGATSPGDAGSELLELTYKGPRQAADTKIRREQTLALDEDPTLLLSCIGFTPGPRLRKTREDWHVDGLAVALDELEGIGTFVEVEVIAEDAAAASREVEAGIIRLGLASARRVEEPYVELARRKGTLT